MGDTESSDKSTPVQPQSIDVTSLVRQAIEEFARLEQNRTEPAYKTELKEEQRRREELERRVNDLIEENKRTRQAAEEAERQAVIRAELQRLGVGKIDLAFKAVKDDIGRTDDGQLVAKTDAGQVTLKEYLAGFVSANPEFLPARITGGAGITSTQRVIPAVSATIDLDNIRPGMTSEEMDTARQEIARIAARALRGS